MDKLISVVIPTFDRKIPTDRAIESVAPTDPKLFEIVIVDDCSTTPYAYERPSNPNGVPVVVLRTSSNVGPGLARKLGVDQCRGRVIAFLDSDDIFEPGWCDAILTEMSRVKESSWDSLFMAGSVSGGTAVQRRCVQFLASAPKSLRSICVRIATIAFNPFYTPATVISKQICTFLSSGRHCEDYFTNAMAIFKAQKIIVLAVTASAISRSPGMSGGLSELKQDMRRGEFHVRTIMMRSKAIPFYYRMLVPLGMVYAALRPQIKSLFRTVQSSSNEPTNLTVRHDAIGNANGQGNSLRLAILGTRGIPAQYGGFETFAEKLAIGLTELGHQVTVYCEKSKVTQPTTFQGVELRYRRCPSLGSLRTIIYDLNCLWSARKGYDIVYMLGYGAAPFCVIPRLWGTEVWINPDGLEWARAKWGFIARIYFRLMEWASIRVADRVIADSEAVATSLASRHGELKAYTVIEYGCEVIEAPPPADELSKWNLDPQKYYLVVCRLEPENHVLEIMQAFQRSRSNKQLIVIGNHLAHSPYIEQLKKVIDARIRMIGTVYDPKALTSLRYHSFGYIHGHSVGGTNPSLLEAMGCGNLIFAHDNPFNRATLGSWGLYFANASELTWIFNDAEGEADKMAQLRRGARQRARTSYQWTDIVSRYENLMTSYKAKVRRD